MVGQGTVVEDWDGSRVSMSLIGKRQSPSASQFENIMSYCDIYFHGGSRPGASVHGRESCQQRLVLLVMLLAIDDLNAGDIRSVHDACSTVIPLRTYLCVHQVRQNEEHLLDLMLLESHQTSGGSWSKIVE
jgi:hypothetical protein